MQKHGFSLLHFIVTLLNSFLYRMAGYFKGEKFHEFRELSLIREKFPYEIAEVSVAVLVTAMHL